MTNPRPDIILSCDFDFFVRELDAWHFDHGEHDLYRIHAWPHRELDFHRHGRDLRAETSLRFANPHPAHFWGALERLGYRFDKLRGIVVADSHRYAYMTFKIEEIAHPERTRLVNFDAHHDLFYSPDKLQLSIRTDTATCENWHFLTLLHYRPLRSLNVYPTWRGLTEWDRSFGKIFRGETETSASIAAHLRRWTEPCVWGDPRVAAAAGSVELIFIARSGAWTPPWHDDAFAAFCKAASRRFRRPLDTPFVFDEELDPLELRTIERRAS